MCNQQVQLQKMLAAMSLNIHCRKKNVSSIFEKAEPRFSDEQFLV